MQEPVPSIPDTSPTTNTDIILYNFENDQENYINKCRPIIEQMIDTELLLCLVNAVKADSFNDVLKDFDLAENNFNQYDIELLTPSLNLMSRILLEGKAALDKLSPEEFVHLPAIIAKRYILTLQNNKPMLAKVSCNIITSIGDSKYEIVVNCYNCTNKGRKTFKPVKGNVDSNDKDLTDSIAREIKEEIGLIVPSRNFKSCEIKQVYGKPMYQFKINVENNKLLCRNYNNDPDMDLEITCIKLKKLKPDEMPMQKIESSLNTMQQTIDKLTAEISSLKTYIKQF